MVMMSDVSAAASANVDYLLMGIARDDTWNWTVGGIVYLASAGTTTNTITQTAPTGTDDVTKILGIATHADRIYFNPEKTIVVHT